MERVRSKANVAQKNRWKRFNGFSMLYAVHVCLLATQKLKENMRQKKKKELK